MPRPHKSEAIIEEDHGNVKPRNPNATNKLFSYHQQRASMGKNARIYNQVLQVRLTPENYGHNWPPEAANRRARDKATLIKQGANHGYPPIYPAFGKTTNLFSKWHLPCEYRLH
jgi:hypothetical protein